MFCIVKCALSIPDRNEITDNFIILHICKRTVMSCILLFLCVSYISKLFHRLFRQRITSTLKQDIFKTEGGHTFFIPIDDGFKVRSLWRPFTHSSFYGCSTWFFQVHGADHIDGKTIDGHVIPKQVLFTTPAKKDIPYQTLASGDNNLRVVITFFEETQGKSKISKKFFVDFCLYWHKGRLNQRQNSYLWSP